MLPLSLELRGRQTNSRRGFAMLGWRVYIHCIHILYTVIYGIVRCVEHFCKKSISRALVVTHMILKVASDRVNPQLLSAGCSKLAATVLNGTSCINKKRTFLHRELEQVEAKKCKEPCQSLVRALSWLVLNMFYCHLPFRHFKYYLLPSVTTAVVITSVFCGLVLGCIRYTNWHRHLSAP